MIRRMLPLAVLITAAASLRRRCRPGSTGPSRGRIVTYRLADVLGTPPAEGIVVNRDTTSHTVTVNVVDSRFNPPQIVKLHELPGSQVRWLRAGTRDGLQRSEIAVDVVNGTHETAYLLRVGKASASPDRPQGQRPRAEADLFSQ